MKKEKDCNCKNLNTVEELEQELCRKKKIPLMVKLRILFEFYVFYFIFVNTSIVNFVFRDKLEPIFPKKLKEKYMNADGKKHQNQN